MKLLVSQKDELYMYIETSDLSPSMFEFEERRSAYSEGQTSTILHFKNTNFYYAFETAPKTINNHFAAYSPGEESFVDYQNPGNWKNQLIYFIKWLEYLKREISTPNSWERLSKEIEDIDIEFESDENKFTAREYEDLRNRIIELKSKVESLDIDNKQAEIINRKLDHLIEMAKDLSKFDWKGLFIGTIVNLIFQLSIPPETGRLLWDFIKQAFNTLFLN